MLHQIALLLKQTPLFAKRSPRQRSSVYVLPSQAYTLAEINHDQLVAIGIQGIILDLDNTIVSEDDRYVSPEAVDWIRRARNLGLQLFILSNGKRRYRVKYWSQYLDIPAINPARKPFPAAFRKAMKQMQLQPEQVIVIGDSRHTDVLGAWVVGCACIQVASLPHPPRWWEKLLGKYVQTPYPTERSLWSFQPPQHYRTP